MNMVNDCWRSTRWLDDFIYSLFGKTIERNPSYSFSRRLGYAVITSENEKINILLCAWRLWGSWRHFLLHHFIWERKELIAHLAVRKRHIVYSKYQALSSSIRICSWHEENTFKMLWGEKHTHTRLQLFRTQCQSAPAQFRISVG